MIMMLLMIMIINSHDVVMTIEVIFHYLVNK